jgi:hypothetical protein
MDAYEFFDIPNEMVERARCERGFLNANTTALIVMEKWSEVFMDG